MSSLLALENLQTTFRTREGEVHAVRGVSFQVQPGELVGIVGESGCGKSVTCKSIIQLLGSNGRITGGSIRFQNDDLAQKTPAGVGVSWQHQPHKRRFTCTLCATSSRPTMA